VVIKAWPEALRKGVKEKTGGDSVDVVERMEAAAAAASCIVIVACDVTVKGDGERMGQKCKQRSPPYEDRS
jgi:hypothetical protein